MSYKSNMSFEVNSDAIISGMFNGDIQARMSCKMKNPNNLENYKKDLSKYRNAGIVDPTPSVVHFIKNHPSVFRNRKLICDQNGNIFEEMLTLAPLSDSADYDERLKNRMTIVHDLTEEEMDGMDTFLQDFHALENEPDIKEIISQTKQYRSSIESLWRVNENRIMEHVQSILGYEPEVVGNVHAYIMYPNYDTHRSCQLSGNSTSLFLGKRGAGTENKILAHLTHQAVHQPMLPYKISMSKKEKDIFHGFIKFLTDKEIYAQLSGESGLKITTPQENHELMGKIYPYWLGYRYRNASKQGLDAVTEIKRTIEKDKLYFESLPEDSKARKNYAHYQFEQLDPEKIAAFFRYKKGMTPYDFVNIDFGNRDNVSKVPVISVKQPKLREERIR